MPTKKTAGLSSGQSLIQFIVMSVLTTLLSATVTFAAPLPARLLRLNYGRWVYWAFTILSSAALVPLSLPWAISQFILLLAIGLFTDLEQMNIPMFYSALSSILISGLSLVLLIIMWARVNGMGLTAVLKTKIDEALSVTQKMQSMDMPITSDQVLSMFPAVIAISLMLLIFVSLVFGKPGDRKERLTAFQVPDFMVWLFIGAMAGTFLIDGETPDEKHFWVQKAFCNLLYVTSAGYYFQGLAVVGFFMKRLKVHYFLKAAVFLVLSLHLFIFVAAFGLSDVWFSYRSKWHRKTVKNNP